MKYLKLYEDSTEKKFVIKNNKFQLFLNDNLVAESGFSIEQPDEWFNQKYATIFELKTDEKYQDFFVIYSY